MFSRVASLLALLPMLLHSILGCCWHHAHESCCGTGNTWVVCQSTVESPANAHTEHATSTCHKHKHTHEHEQGTGNAGESPTGPCPDSPCDEERCLFASTSTGVLPQTVMLQLGWCNSFFGATVELPAPVNSPVAAREKWLGRRPPGSAGQRRALTQVWLI
jgi:hypothetical protein